jgi:cytochrome c
MFRRVFSISLIAVVLLTGVTAADAQLRGHGGPVRALAVSADGKTLLSGSFDSTAIRWSLDSNTATDVLRFHDGAVNAVAILPDGRLVTAGEDGRIALWPAGAKEPSRILQGHTAPIVGLAVSRDGHFLVSASWDHSVRLWPLAGDGPPRVLEGHSQNVNGVAFTPDGKSVVSAGYDASLRIWPLAGDGAPLVVALPAPLNAVVVAPDGEIVTADAQGALQFIGPTGERRATVEAAPTPIIALALSPDGKQLAAAGIRGSVSIIDRTARKLVTTLVGPGLPVWSVAFMPDNVTLISGGADRTIRRWNTTTGEPIGAAETGAPSDPLAAYSGDRGAEVFRACVACHTLSRDQGNRAGPTLAGIFGRKIATLPGYNFSAALKKLDIVWTPEAVAKLFEVGPATYTPGTKMPEQKIGSAEDRAALVRFLEKATRQQ